MEDTKGKIDKLKLMELMSPIDEEQMTRLAGHLSRDQVMWLTNKKEGDVFLSLVERYKKGLPSEAELFGLITTYGYYEQEIQVNTSIKIKVRTLLPAMYDETERVVMKEEQTVRAYQRAVQLRQLAWSIQAVNGDAPRGASMSTSASYLDLTDGAFELLSQRTDNVLKYLTKMLPESVMNLYSTHRSAWDTAVLQVINGINVGEAIKNS